MRVGFIGVGHLGRHLAASLVRAGFPLTVHDRKRAAAADLLAAGAARASCPHEVAVAADTVITCRPSPAAVATVVTGDAGVVPGLHAGGTWIDMSTNDRTEVQRLAALAAAHGIACLEAPVTGGVHQAAAGTITVLVGGDPLVYEAHRPLLQAMGGTVLHIGPLGSASMIKVITNMLAFIHLVAMGEALMLAKRGGLDLATTFAAIKASSGTSFVHETESQLILSGSYNIGFTLDLACKDLLLAQQLGHACGVPLELGGLVEQIFLRAHAHYGGAASSGTYLAIGNQVRPAAARGHVHRHGGRVRLWPQRTDPGPGAGRRPVPPGRGDHGGTRPRGADLAAARQPPPGPSGRAGGQGGTTLWPLRTMRLALQWWWGDGRAGAVNADAGAITVRPRKPGGGVADADPLC